MADLTRDGVRIRYHVSGPGLDGSLGAPGAVTEAGEPDHCGGSAEPERAGPTGNLPVLLSHGFGETSRMWEPNLPALAAEHTVITWDMRGHGHSDSPQDPGEYTQDACVADMAALLDAAGARRAVVGGLSLGGYLSLAFWLAHPERVAALMLFDTGPGFRSDDARQRWNERAYATAARFERGGPASPGAANEGAGPGDAAGGHAAAGGLALAARGMLTQHDARVIEALPSVSVPVLVLVGANDRPFLGAAEYVAAKVPDATRVVIPDAGHVCNIDQPGLFNREVLGFLGRLADRTKA